MAQILVAVAEHFHQLVEDLAFHHGGGFAAINRMVVGIQHHGGGVRSHRDGVRRLEHLPRVLRVEEREVVVQSFRQLGKHTIHQFGIHLLRFVNIPLAVCGLQRVHAADNTGQYFGQHDRLLG